MAKEKLPLMGVRTLSQFWYEDAAKLEANVLGSAEGGKDGAPSMEGDKWNGFVQKKTAVCEKLMAQYSGDYELTIAKSNDMKMAVSAQRSGTAADKVAAFTVLIQDNPLANLRSLDALIAMVSSKIGKRHALTGFDALRELFLSSLLPDRKLKYFFQHPLDRLPETKDDYSLLLFWYWEDCLKKRFERFVAALEEASKDTLYILKKKSLKTLYKLLEGKPEQERRVLSAVVNKLGDPEARVASDASYFLTCLLSTHPNMKLVVIEEVDFFIFRPHVGLRAKCHAVNFLNQIVLHSNGEGPKVAKRLVDIYFALFKVLISKEEPSENASHEKKKMAKQIAKKDLPDKKHNTSSFAPAVEMDSRLLSALLIGVNRAFPFVATEEADSVIEHQTPVLFKLAHSKNFNVGVQALMLLFQILAKNQAVSDRFYRALYSYLLVPSFMKSSSSERFLALLLQAMKSDLNMKRLSACSKRLLQVSLHQPPHYACGCLVLLSEVLKARPALWNMLMKTESADDELEHFKDVMEDSQDNNNNSLNDTSMHVVSEPDADDINGDSDSAESQNLSTAERSDSEGDEDLFKSIIEAKPSPTVQVAAREHEDRSDKSNVRASLLARYDVNHREPSFCNADQTGWWELATMASHVHPSVSTMARTLLSGAFIVYNGEPIRDLSLSAFLDKFIEKKPKSSWRSGGTWHGGSEIAPTRKLDMNKHVVGREMLSLAEEEVPPEDIVFHKFYMNKKDSSKRMKKKKKTEDEEADDLLGIDNVEDGSDDGQSESEEIDEFLEASASMPVESDGEYDYDKLDEVIDNDDEELLADGSDNETNALGDFGDSADENDDICDDENLEGDELHAQEDAKNRRKRKLPGHRGRNLSDDEEDDLSASDDESSRRKHKKFHRKKSSASPFASLEEYAHLMNGEGNERRGKSHKKKRHT